MAAKGTPSSVACIFRRNGTTLGELGHTRQGETLLCTLLNTSKEATWAPSKKEGK